MKRILIIDIQSLRTHSESTAEMRERSLHFGLASVLASSVEHSGRAKCVAVTFLYGVGKGAIALVCSMCWHHLDIGAVWMAIARRKNAIGACCALGGGLIVLDRAVVNLSCLS